MAKTVDRTGETVKIRFIRNTAWDGVDYGPDYKRDSADLPAWQARTLIAKGRAVEAPVPATKADKAGKTEE